MLCPPEYVLMEELWELFSNHYTGEIWAVSEDEPPSFEEYESRMAEVDKATETFLQFCPSLSICSPANGAVLRVSKSVLDVATAKRSDGGSRRAFRFLDSHWRIRSTSRREEEGEGAENVFEPVYGWFLTFHRRDLPSSQREIQFWFDFWEFDEEEPSSPTGGRPSKVKIVMRSMLAGVTRSSGEPWKEFQARMAEEVGFDVSVDTLRRATNELRLRSEAIAEARATPPKVPQNT